MKCNRGFTLIELIIVIFIMFIMINILGFTLSNGDRRELNKAALELQSDLRLAQRLAIINGKEFQVSFNILNNSYQIRERIANSSLPSYRVHKTVNFGSNIQLYNVNAGRGTQIRYTSTGTTGDACTITIMSKNYILKLTVNVGSGRIDVKDLVPI